MNHIAQIQEEYIATKTHKILTRDMLNIPGLSLFGYQSRKSAQDSLPVHNHKSNFELVYVVSGTPKFYIGQNEYRLSGGDVFITQPYQLHSTSSEPFSVSEIYWIQIDFSKCADALYLDSGTADELLSALKHIEYPVINTDQTQMKQLVQDAFNIMWSGGNPRFAAQYLTLFLYLLLNYSSCSSMKLSADIQCAVNYIQKNICKKITLEEVADACYLSTSHFKQKFKQQYGISPRQFINGQKIEYAKNLLQEGFSIAEVAEKLNFESTSYFITVFKRYTAYTPGSYLEQKQQ